VIVEPSRLGSVFLVLASVSRLLGRRLFCPNYYVPADRLEIPPADLYVARELDQARSLAGTGDALRGSNAWLADVFPNALASPAPAGPASRPLLQRLLEAPLRGSLGNRVERLGLRVAAARLRAHFAAFGSDVPADVATSFTRGDNLRFHAGGLVESRMRRYAERREQVAERLRQIDGAGAAIRVSAR
jgi:hypothetical protein